MGSILDFFKKKDQQIAEMEGKRGVVELRKQRTALKAAHAKHEAQMQPADIGLGEWNKRYTREQIDRLAAASGNPRRDAYDALVMPNVPQRFAKHPRLQHLAWAARAKQIIEAAQDNDVLPDEFADFDSRGRGTCLNIDLYGYADGLALVQVRETTVSKWGSSPRKSYYVTDGTRKVEVSKSKIRRAAQQLSELDAPLRAVKNELPEEWQARLGEQFKLKAPEAARWTAYKIVVRKGSALVNPRDGKTEYVIGKQLKEKARDDHNGGFYVFEDADALRADPTLALNEKWVRGETLVLIECECIGTPIRYGKKLAVSLVRPTRIVDEWTYES